jgi:D-sedoheptulose 7-phosphate isomerase
VPSRETFRIQEYHLPIYHVLCLLLEDALFS